MRKDEGGNVTKIVNRKECTVHLGLFTKIHIKSVKINKRGANNFFEKIIKKNEQRKLWNWTKKYYAYTLGLRSELGLHI